MQSLGKHLEFVAAKHDAASKCFKPLITSASRLVSEHTNAVSKANAIIASEPQSQATLQSKSAGTNTAQRARHGRYKSSGEVPDVASREADIDDALLALQRANGSRQYEILQATAKAITSHGRVLFDLGRVFDSSGAKEDAEEADSIAHARHELARSDEAALARALRQRACTEGFAPSVDVDSGAAAAQQSNEAAGIAADHELQSLTQSPRTNTTERDDGDDGGHQVRYDEDGDVEHEQARLSDTEKPTSVVRCASNTSARRSTQSEAESVCGPEPGSERYEHIADKLRYAENSDEPVFQGYLAKHSSGSTFWRSRYFVLWADGSLTYACRATSSIDEHKQTVPLILATVKNGNGRSSFGQTKQAFRVVSPAKELTLQASTQSHRDDWRDHISVAVREQLYGLARSSTVASARSSATGAASPLPASTASTPSSSPAAVVSPSGGNRDDRHQRNTLQKAASHRGRGGSVLEQIQAAESKGNTVCADCGARNAPSIDWASINVGVMLCSRCAGVHRSMGSHLTVVRSVRLDRESWDYALLQRFVHVGSAISSGTLEGKFSIAADGSIREHADEETQQVQAYKPHSDSSDVESRIRTEFVQKKYAERAFLQPVNEGTAANALDAAIASLDPTAATVALLCGADATCNERVHRVAEAGSEDNMTSQHTAVLAVLDALIRLAPAGSNATSLPDSSKQQLTPLHRAVLAGREHNALALISRGANVNARDAHNRTPLDTCMHQRGRVHDGSLLLALQGGSVTEDTAAENESEKEIDNAMNGPTSETHAETNGTKLYRRSYRSMLGGLLGRPTSS